MTQDEFLDWVERVHVYQYQKIKKQFTVISEEKQPSKVAV